MEDFKQAVERARQAGACRYSLEQLEQMSGWDEFFARGEAAYWAYWYARNVIEGRWPEAESVIAQYVVSAYYYRQNVFDYSKEGNA